LQHSFSAFSKTPYNYGNDNLTAKGENSSNAKIKMNIDCQYYSHVGNFINHNYLSYQLYLAHCSSIFSVELNI